MKLKYKIFFPLFLIVILSLHAKVNFKTEKSKLAVCYYYSESRDFYPHSEIQYYNLTHICHSFIWPDSLGNLIISDDFLYPELIEEAHKNDVKVLISLGGWGQDSGFANTAADPTAKKNFINNLVEFCTSNNYDGADLDWEYPKEKDRDNLVMLIAELRNAFDDAGIELLSAALPSTDFKDGFDILGLKNHLDWFGIMTYDFHGSWTDHSGHNSPLYSSPLDSCGSIDNSVNYYLSKGIPKEKLLIGIPFYGRAFNSSTLYLPSSGGTSSNYQQSNAKLLEEKWEHHWDEICNVPYLKDPDDSLLITFDDQASIKLKCRFVHENNLGGSIVWALSNDYDGSSQPLLEMLGKELLNPPLNIPSVPIISYPLKEENNLTFSWHPAKDAWKYDIQISKDSLFSEIFIEKNDIKFLSFTTDQVNNNGYYWRVNGKNYLGSSDWSETGKINSEN